MMNVRVKKKMKENKGKGNERKKDYGRSKHGRQSDCEEK